MALARVRFDLGEQRAALDGLWSRLSGRRINGPFHRGAMLYGELSERAGQADEGLRRLDSIGMGELYRRHAAIRRAFEQRDPEAIYRAALGSRGTMSPFDPTTWEAARRLVELGPEGVSFLRERIAAGDREAILIATSSSHPDLLAALAARAPHEQDQVVRSLIQYAVADAARGDD